MPETRQGGGQGGAGGQGGTGAQATALTVEPYKLSEIFAIVPEYDGNPIFLNTFISACDTASDMAQGNQQQLLVLHIKNKLRGRAAELVNSRNPSTWNSIQTLLNNHFGDPRNLSSLIQDLQRMKQLTPESPLTFAARLQTHHAKMLASINKQNLTNKEKQAQIDLIDSMALNSLLTGLEPKIGQIVRASDPKDILTAVSRIKRELQLYHLETQKFPVNKGQSLPPRKPTPFAFQKQCSFCKKTGHSFNECMLKARQFQPNPYSSNFRLNFPSQPNQSQNFYQNRNFPQNQYSQPQPSTSRFNPGPSQQKPAPNFFKTQQQKTHHLNNFENYDYTQYENQFENQYPIFQDNSPNFYQQPQDDFDYYSQNFQCPGEEHFIYNSEESYQNFRDPQIQSKPPDNEISTIQTQIQTLNLDDYNPHLNFPEQNFL